MFLILSVNVTLLPVAVAFYDDSIDPGWLTLNIVTDIFFVVDIVLNFWTGLITSDNFVILELSRIRRTYLRCWLWIDLIAVCPLDYLALGLSNIASVRILLQAARALVAFRLVRLLSLLRLLRVVKFMKNLSKWEEVCDCCNILCNYFFSVYQYYQVHNPHCQSDTTDVPDSSLEWLCPVPCTIP